MQRKLEQQSEDITRDSDKLRKLEEARRQTDHELRHVKDSRGKVFRGLNTQTEIVKVQFQRDFEHLKKQLQSKEEMIAILEKKVDSLMEANCTLSSGLEELNTLPQHTSSDSEDDDLEVGGTSLDYGNRGILNGHTHAIHSNANVLGPLPTYTRPDDHPGVNSDLFHVISQLGSGKFDS